MNAYEFLRERYLLAKERGTRVAARFVQEAFEELFPDLEVPPSIAVAKAVVYYHLRVLEEGITCLTGPERRRYSGIMGDPQFLTEDDLLQWEIADMSYMPGAESGLREAFE